MKKYIYVLFAVCIHGMELASMPILNIVNTESRNAVVAATKIQAIYRGHLVRQAYLARQAMEERDMLELQFAVIGGIIAAIIMLIFLYVNFVPLTILCR